VVQPIDLRDVGPKLATELLAFCRSRLSQIKCLRTIGFAAELPRTLIGKLLKRVLRDPMLAAAEGLILDRQLLRL
jgi:long-chain acyl-CoA synthetase